MCGCLKKNKNKVPSISKLAVFIVLLGSSELQIFFFNSSLFFTNYHLLFHVWEADSEDLNIDLLTHCKVSHYWARSPMSKKSSSSELVLALHADKPNASQDHHILSFPIEEKSLQHSLAVGFAFLFFLSMRFCCLVSFKIKQWLDDASQIFSNSQSNSCF